MPPSFPFRRADSYSPRTQIAALLNICLGLVAYEVGHALAVSPHRQRSGGRAATVGVDPRHCLGCCDLGVSRYPLPCMDSRHWKPFYVLGYRSRLCLWKGARVAGGEGPRLYPFLTSLDAGVCCALSALDAPTLESRAAATGPLDRGNRPPTGARRREYRGNESVGEFPFPFWWRSHGSVPCRISATVRLSISGVCFWVCRHASAPAPARRCLPVFRAILCIRIDEREPDERRLWDVSAGAQWSGVRASLRSHTRQTGHRCRNDFCPPQLVERKTYRHRQPR